MIITYWKEKGYYMRMTFPTMSQIGKEQSTWPNMVATSHRRLVST